MISGWLMGPINHMSIIKSVSPSYFSWQESWFSGRKCFQNSHMWHCSCISFPTPLSSYITSVQAQEILQSSRRPSAGCHQPGPRWLRECSAPSALTPSGLRNCPGLRLLKVNQRLNHLKSFMGLAGREVDRAF